MQRQTPHKSEANLSNQNHTQVTILEQLRAREHERQLELDIRQRHKEQLEGEDPDYFAHQFSELAEDIRKEIKDTVETFTAKPFIEEKTDSRLPPQKHFTKHVERISELQRYITSSTRFLPDYKIKACQEVVSELTNYCDESRQRIIPKKKFGFSARKASKKASSNDKTDGEEKEKTDTPKPVLSDNSEQLYLDLSSKFDRFFIDRQNEYIFESKQSINGNNVTLANLKNCFIELQGHPSSLRASNLIDCVVICGPISTSVYADNCQKTTFAVACQQLRLHSSNACVLYLHVTCRAIIEDCNDIQVGSYSYKYATVEQDFLDAKLEKSVNNYTDVADFNWLSPEVPSPNWKLITNENENVDFDCMRAKFEKKIALNVL